MRAFEIIRLIAITTALVLCGTAGSALAQRTGGSMGGGSFGGSSSSSYSSSSSSYSSSGSGYSSSYSSYDSGSYSSSGPTDPFFLIVLLVGGGFILLVKLAGARATSIAIPNDLYDGSGGGSHGSSFASRMDVTALKLGIDWRARQFVQKELERIAKTCDTSSKPGLMKMLRETTTVLRRVMPSWLYAGATNARPTAAANAERMFRREAQEARSRFQQELIRNVDGQVSASQAHGSIALSEEGEGIVVVTVVVAAREELIDIHDPENSESMRRALEALGSMPQGSLVAVEIVWSPAEEDDRMSSAELEVLYPELHRIRGSTVAGRVFCSFCSGPYPAELVSCPHCGGRADDEAHPAIPLGH